MNDIWIGILGVLIGATITFLGKLIFYKLNKSKFIYDCYQKEIDRKNKILHDKWRMISEMEESNYMIRNGITAMAYDKNDILKERVDAEILFDEIELLAKKSLKFLK